jgi:hypothetical protein
LVYKDNETHERICAVAREPFYTEYLQYHKIDESIEPIKPRNKPNQNFNFPEFDFDNF